MTFTTVSAALGGVFDEWSARTVLVTAVDLTLVYYLIYRLLLTIKGTRAAQMVAGIVAVGAAFFVAERLELTTISWLLDNFINYLIIIVIVIFQGDMMHLPRHPSQLYEAALEGLLLLAYGQWRFWRTDAPVKQPGRLSGEFLIGYAVVRMICEIFREPDASLLFGLSRGTFFSIFIAAGGAWLIWLSSRRRA